MENTFGSWLREQLKNADITQGELAQKIGIQQSQISRIISGERGTSIDVLEGIARVLRIQPEIVFRVASGKTPIDINDDPWLVEQRYKLSLLDPDMRPVAGRLIDSLIQSEAASGKSKQKPKAKPSGA